MIILKLLITYMINIQMNIILRDNFHANKSTIYYFKMRNVKIVR